MTANRLFTFCYVAFAFAFSTIGWCEESLYHWQPVRLGAGGLVTGFVTHPLDASVRYCRTDVGNAYRWDGKEWRPMLVHEKGRGMPADLASAPAVCGVESVAVDPQNPKVVYLAFRGERARSVAKLYPSIPGSVYKSINGGQSFARSQLSIEMEPNGPWRGFGERLSVDPFNGRVLYYGSVKQGLHRSVDGGKTWSVLNSPGGPGNDTNVLALHFVPRERHQLPDGTQICKSLYAVVANGSVHQSVDGGETWSHISSGQPLDGKCKRSRMSPDGILWVFTNGQGVPNTWQHDGKAWVSKSINVWGGIHDVAFHPDDPKKLFVIGSGGRTHYSTDGGLNWIATGGDLSFSNTFGWLPQPIGYRSNTATLFDREGVLWMSMGNEGMLRCNPTFQENEANPLKWTIDSVGIEEFVTHDVILPPGGDTVFAVEDATGLVSSDITEFVARQIPLQDQLISNGTGLAYCPNAPQYLAVVTADVNYTSSGKCFSGYSSDGGKTWNRFGGLPVDVETKSPMQPAGSIAISRREGWSDGGDHLVWLPTGQGPSFWSHDGGKTWNPSEGFPLKNGYWNFSLKQRSLAADPHVADKFYFIGTWQGGFYVSVDGGKSWQKEEDAGLPNFTHHAQLATNREVKDDLWFVDGWDGTNQHGLWHSTNGGKQFAKLNDVEYAITLCLGASRGNAGDAPYTVYFYGLMASDKNWGIFRSCDAGKSWTRISYYPMGIFDQPTCMAAPWDEFSKVVVGFTGNSFVWGVPSAH